jgi:long-subunit fatty acid transport protein
MIAIPLAAMAQNFTRSPYSAFGIGEQHFGGTVKQFGMGQLSLTLNNPFEINSTNPASYGSLLQTVIEAGAEYSNGTLTNATSSSPVESYSFSYFRIAFPVSYKLKWGFGFGLDPYSNMGYDVSSKAIFPDYTATIKQKGMGGLTRFYGGTGISLFKGFSAGIQASYIFGTLENTQTLIIPSEFKRFNIENQNRIIAGDFQFQYSFQYQHNLKDTNYRVIIAGSIMQQSNLSAQREFFVKSMGIGGLIGVVDTIDYRNNISGNIILPASYALGIGLNKKDKWFVGAEANYTQWSDYRIFGSSDSLFNSFGINAGGSWVPNYLDFKNYFSRVEYRAGIRYNNGSLKIDGENIGNLGLSVGLGLPLGKSRNKLNIGFEYLMRGTTKVGLIQEEYFRFTLGVSVSDKWFTRYKYD